MLIIAQYEFSLTLSQILNRSKDGCVYVLLSRIELNLDMIY